MKSPVYFFRTSTFPVFPLTSQVSKPLKLLCQFSYLYAVHHPLCFIPAKTWLLIKNSIQNLVLFVLFLDFPYKYKFTPVWTSIILNSNFSLLCLFSIVYNFYYFFLRDMYILAHSLEVLDVCWYMASFASWSVKCCNVTSFTDIILEILCRFLLFSEPMDTSAR